jgi:hypothetical protein
MDIKINNSLCSLITINDTILGIIVCVNKNEGIF